MISMNKAILLDKGKGTSYWVLGDLYTFKVTGKETGRALTIIDQIIQPQGGPPPHIHMREDEAFYIHEGTFSFLCRDKEAVFEAGSFVYVPKGTLHTFKNIGNTAGKLMVVITPAGLEDFFYAIGSAAEGTSHPPAFDPAIIDKVMRLAKEYHMEVMVPEDGRSGR